MGETLGVRIVGADEERVVADELHDGREQLFARVGVDPDVPAQVLADRPLHLRGVAHVLVAVLEAFDPLAHPTAHRLDRGRAQLGKAVEHPVVHHRRQRHARVLDDVHGDEHEAGKAVPIPRAAQVVVVRGRVDADRQPQVFGRGPDRIVIGMPEALRVHGCRADHDRPRAQLGDAPDLRHGRAGVA